MPPPKKTISRRKFLAGSALGVTATALGAQDNLTSRQATGVKVGEVSDTAAIVWMRLTANAGPNAKGKDLPRGGKVIELPKGIRVEELRGACPGANGRVRVRMAPTSSSTTPG